MTVDEKRLAFQRREEAKRSAIALLNEGIRLRSTDPKFAQLSFGMAEERFASVDDHWNAQIAQKWKLSIAATVGSFTKLPELA